MPYRARIITASHGRGCKRADYELIVESPLVNGTQLISLDNLLEARMRQLPVADQDESATDLRFRAAVVAEVYEA